MGIVRLIRDFNFRKSNLDQFIFMERKALSEEEMKRVCRGAMPKLQVA